jgi:hypothetical protein
MEFGIWNLDWDLNLENGICIWDRDLGSESFERRKVLESEKPLGSESVLKVNRMPGSAQEFLPPSLYDLRVLANKCS